MGEAFITRRGGGANLNFRVNDYPTDTDLDEIVGKVNEIAVMTDTPMTDWTLSMEEPENPVEGDVWVKTAMASLRQIEMLKKHSVLVNLAVAFQYDGADWVRKQGWLWQNDEWINLAIFLFDHGDTCDLMTGGWLTLNDSNGRAAVMSDHIYMGSVSSGSAENVAFTMNKIALSGYTKLCANMNVTSAGSGNRVQLGLFARNNSYHAYDNSPIVSATIPQQTGVQKLEVDISAYKDSSNYYVGLRNQTSYANVYEIWLE